MKTNRNKQLTKKSNKLTKLIAQQQSVFNIPAGTVKDGMDKLPTIQALS